MTRSVVIDTDMAPDDWLAMLYLLATPDISVKAISVSGSGEAHCAAGVRNALDLVGLAGQSDIPVSCGSETPLVGTHAFPQPWRDEVDGLLGLTLATNPAEPAGMSAPELLKAALASAPNKVSLLTLGPLTNVAQMLNESPSSLDKVDGIYVMGGAVGVDGNVGVSGVGIDNQFAEWNVYVDPTAADTVLSTGLASLVPLDATNSAPVTVDFLDRLTADATTPSAAFARDVLEKRRPFIEQGGYFFWDPLAAAILADPSLASFATSGLAVQTAEGPESGRVSVQADRPPSKYAISADPQHFEELLLDRLNGR